MASLLPSPRKQTDLAGLFTTVSETPVPVQLEVSGIIPVYLDGILYRNGSSMFETAHKDGNKTEVNHWFDGVAMLHRFVIDGKTNTVQYSSRIAAPGIIRASNSVSKRDYVPGITFGVQDPCKSIFRKLISMFIGNSKPTADPATGRFPGNASVTVENIPSLGLMARTDSTTMCKFNPETLESSEFMNWATAQISTGDSTVDPSGHLSAAHGQFDASRGEYFNFSQKLGAKSGPFKILKISDVGGLEVIAEINDPCSYVHSMALTERFLVFIICPIRIHAARVMLEKSLLGGMKFDTSARTKFHVVSRIQNRVIGVYETDPFFMFHVLNAFEDTESGDLCIDLVRYKNADILDQLYVKNLRSKPSSFFSSSNLYRYTLSGVITLPNNLTPLRMHHQELSPIPFELPRFNEKLHMKPYRYAYGVSDKAHVDNGTGDPVLLFSQLAKIDTSNPSQTLTWSAFRTFVGEPVFVPDPQGESEDDGVLCCIVYEAAQLHSALVVLDARTMTEVARATCPSKLPGSFHGAFF